MILNFDKPNSGYVSEKKINLKFYENILYGNIDKIVRNAKASGCILTGQGILNWFPWRKTGLFQNPHQPIQQCGDPDLSV